MSVSEAADELVLAIESATSRLAVALLRRDGSAVERDAGTGAGHHAERILSLVGEVLEEAGYGPDDPTALAVSIGPGSFTSLRVGLATAKGLAFGTRRPVVAVPTLEALARGAVMSGDATPIAAVLDARRGEVYAALFAPEAAGLRCLVPDGLFSPEALVEQLPAPCRLVGEGARLLASAVRARSGAGIALPPDDPAVAWPRAAVVAQIGRERLRAGLAADDDLAPRYVRRAEAEAKRTARAVEDPA